MNTDESGGTREEATKGRKRKKLAKVDAPETSDASGKAAEEIDPIMATIEAVLANASALDTSVPKKAKRMKKQDGNVVKSNNQDGEKSAADELENDDDSSTTGNKREVFERG